MAHVGSFNGAAAYPGASFENVQLYPVTIFRSTVDEREGTDVFEQSLSGLWYPFIATELLKAADGNFMSFKKVPGW